MHRKIPEQHDLGVPLHQVCIPPRALHLVLLDAEIVLQLLIPVAPGVKARPSLDCRADHNVFVAAGVVPDETLPQLLGLRFEPSDLPESFVCCLLFGRLDFSAFDLVAAEDVNATV